MNELLSSAVNGVYDAFKTVRRPAKIDGCRCCIEDKQVHVLLSKPLRELTPDELTSYASSVFLTVGSEKDFRYYLPRILEIAVTNPSWWPDPEVIGSALKNGRWQSWTESEKKSVVRLFETVFDQLTEQPDGYELDSWLCGFSRSGLTLVPFLAKLAKNQAAILEFYGRNAGQIASGQLGSEFWDDAPLGKADVLAWFRRPPASLVVFENYGVDLGSPPVPTR